MPAFNSYSALLLKTAIDAGITSPRELANLMGNASVETGGFSTMHERFGYRSAEDLIGAVRSADDRFSLTQIREAIASGDPSRIATMAYERRADLGNSEPGDGWRFHGRGFFQYTGRDNYTRYGEKFGVDLANDPDRAAEPVLAAKLAVAYWQDKVPRESRDDPRRAGAIINGGSNGADARVERSAQWARELTPELIADVGAGRIDLERLAAMGTPQSGRRAAAADGVLRQGEAGAEIKLLQQRLNRLGFGDEDGRALATDGRFGPGTRHAVEAFQREHRLNEDGVAGRATLRALKDAVAAAEEVWPERPDRGHLADVAAVPVRGDGISAGASLSDAAHPDHAMYRQALAGLEQLGSSAGLAGREQVERAAAVMVYEARVSGLARIDHVVLSADGTRVFAVEGDLRDPGHRRVVADRGQVAGESVEAVSRALQRDVGAGYSPVGANREALPVGKAVPA